MLTLITRCTPAYILPRNFVFSRQIVPLFSLLHPDLRIQYPQCHTRRATA